MTDFYGGKDPADAITYSHKFVEKLTGLRPKGKRLSFYKVWQLAHVMADENLRPRHNHFVIEWGDYIELHPFISFGSPVIKDHGIKTSIIYARHKGGETIAEIAEDYDIAEVEVKAAIEFEEVMK